MKNWYKFLPILLVLFTAVACKKKTGPQGPAGPQGAQGTQGNANVISTGTIAVTSWTLSSGNVYYSNYIYVPQLDSATYVSGAVMVYYLNSSSFYQLPFSDAYTTIEQEYGLNYVKLYVYNTDHTTPSFPAGVVIRIVMIPPALKRAYPGVDYSDYKEVRQVFGLKD